MANDRFFECPICGKKIEYHHIDSYDDPPIAWAISDFKWGYHIAGKFTSDCHGIPYRLVCFNCYDKCMEKGYDGEYYTELDEQIEPDY